MSETLELVINVKESFENNTQNCLETILIYSEIAVIVVNMHVNQYFGREILKIFIYQDKRGDL